MDQEEKTCPCLCHGIPGSPICYCEPKNPIMYRNDLAMAKDMDAVEKRLDNLEDMSKKAAHLINYKSYLDLADRIETLESLINKLKEDFESKLDVDLDKWKQYFSEVFPPKKPHKCPVCDGKGKDKDRLVAEPYDQHIKVLVSPDCKSCEGKGIVWG